MKRKEEEKKEEEQKKRRKEERRKIDKRLASSDAFSHSDADQLKIDAEWTVAATSRLMGGIATSIYSYFIATSIYLFI